MSDWIGWLQNASFVVVVLVSSLSVLQRGLLKQRDETIASLRGDLSDTRARVSDRDTELVDLKADHAAELETCQTQVAELQASVTVLSKTVTGEVHLVAISDQVEHVNTQVVEIRKLLEGQARDADA